MKDLDKIIKKFIPEKRNKDYAYKMGYDCGLNGSNLTNCAFNIFSSPENTKEWERGKREAELFEWKGVYDSLMEELKAKDKEIEELRKWILEFRANASEAGQLSFPSKFFERLDKLLNKRL